MEGIKPGELSEIDVIVSYQRDAKDMSSFGHMDSMRPWYIICSDSKLYWLWRGIDILCCLLSSYFYAYIGTFKAPSYGER
jgi:hypothetical protein